MKELGRATSYNTHKITSLIRTPQDILQTEETFRVEEYKHTHRAVSIVVNGKLANEAVNYDKKTKA